MSKKKNTIPAPSWTQVPNVILDALHELGDAELRVVLALVRALRGWHKIEDDLSLSQLQRKTGLSRQGVLNGIQAAEERGLILVIRTGNTNRYRLNVEDDSKPRKRPPAADVYREVFHRWPSRPQWALLDEVEDLDRWRQACLKWLGAGYNPQNIAGILDWYAGKGGRNGRIRAGAREAQYDETSIE